MKVWVTAIEIIITDRLKGSDMKNEDVNKIGIKLFTCIPGIKPVTIPMPIPRSEKRINSIIYYF